ncbi:hypothetical protein KBA63_05880 [Candidatus Woesebacteria bacterium]|nr:hypothetical protein [Candidatus Woesebacteria bacterium]MBP9687790.1 hypothetical protein [Candidatus Woesebacteria bacterium]
MKELPLHPRPTASGIIDQILFAIRTCFGPELKDARAICFDEDANILLIKREQAPDVQIVLVVVAEKEKEVVA